MKKIGTVVLTLLMTLTLNIKNVIAADITYAKDGWNALNATEVQLLSKKLTLTNANNEDGISYTGDFKLFRNKHYDDYTSGGLFDQERNNPNIVTYTGFGDGLLTVAYTGTLSAGVHDINGTITIKWKNAAKLMDGSYCDVTMHIDNFKIKLNRANTKPISVIYETSNNLWAGAWFASQESAAADLTSGHGPKYVDVALSYDINVSVTKHGTNESISKNMAFAFKDIDAPDRTVGTAESPDSARVDSNNNPVDYVESVTLINGVRDKIHLTEDSYLQTTNTTYGANTRYSATAGTEDTAEHPNETIKSGLITLVDSANFKFRWAGSSCGTSIAGITPSVVATSTSGEYPNKVTITETDDETLWKEDKDIIMNPDDGFHVSKITIDNVVIPYDTLPIQNGIRTYTNNGVTYTFKEAYDDTVTYVFDDVINDHKIDVQVEPNNYIIHYDAGGGKGTMEDTEAEYDVEGNLSKNEFTNEGYTFTGWKAYYKDDTGKLVELKDENGKVITFKDKDEFINLIGKNNGEVTLVAQWKKPLIVNVPKTSMQTPLIILGVGLIAVAAAVGVYVYKGKKIIKKM